MKVIYIPVVIPMNMRTFMAMGLMFVGGVITLIAVVSNSWFVAQVDMTSGFIDNTDDPDKSTTYLALRQGLQVVNVEACSRDRTMGNLVTCKELHVNYMQCARGRDDVYNWCEGRSSYLAVFTMALISGICGIIGWVVALYRENKLLYPAGFTSLLNFIAAIVYFSTYRSAVDGALYPSIRQYAALGDGAKFVSALGVSYGLLWVATTAFIMAFALSLSALWTGRKTSEPVIITSDLPVGAPGNGVHLRNSIVLQFDTNSSFFMERPKHVDGTVRGSPVAPVPFTWGTANTPLKVAAARGGQTSAEGKTAEDHRVASRDLDDEEGTIVAH